MEGTKMIEKIITLFLRCLFGKQYLNGYVVEKQDEQREYRLMGLFPNDIAKTRAIKTLGKESTLDLNDIKK